MYIISHIQNENTNSRTGEYMYFQNTYCRHYTCKNSTRFVGKPEEGISNLFLTPFDYFFGGQYTLGGLRGTRID